MNIQELTDKCTELDKLINSTIISDIEDTFPILDGVFDPEKYLSAKYKILWILKEPYDKFDGDGIPFGGGWAYCLATSVLCSCCRQSCAACDRVTLLHSFFFITYFLKMSRQVRIFGNGKAFTGGVGSTWGSMLCWLKNIYWPAYR